MILFLRRLSSNSSHFTLYISILCWSFSFALVAGSLSSSLIAYKRLFSCWMKLIFNQKFLKVIDNFSNSTCDDPALGDSDLSCPDFDDLVDFPLPGLPSLKSPKRKRLDDDKNNRQNNGSILPWWLDHLDSRGRRGSLALGSFPLLILCQETKPFKLCFLCCSLLRFNSLLLKSSFLCLFFSFLLK